MSLSNIRDLLIIIGIYLYFVAWVYLHNYYESFGISTESLRIDYSSYLIFSYNVLSSGSFVHFAIWVAAILAILKIALHYILRGKSRIVHKRFLTIRNAFLILGMVALFPILFNMAKQTALENYAADRTNTSDKHRVEFIFRKDAGFDSTANATNYHLKLLSTDNGRNLRLLGESDQYYIVLNQLPMNSIGIPEGAVYYVNKNDVLVSHIILSSR
jgi:hypothetical protein